MSRNGLRRILKIQLIVYTIYILIVLGGALLIYLLVPQEVWNAIRATYFSDQPGEF